jgi:hypothetical protein
MLSPPIHPPGTLQDLAAILRLLHRLLDAEHLLAPHLLAVSTAYQVGACPCVVPPVPISDCTRWSINPPDPFWGPGSAILGWAPGDRI